jgi:hypothetical protein
MEARAEALKSLRHGEGIPAKDITDTLTAHDRANEAPDYREDPAAWLNDLLAPATTNGGHR